MAQMQAQKDTSWQYTAPLAMDDIQFQQWVSLLEARTGISLPPSRKTFLVTNLNTRMRELRVMDYQRYFNMVTDGMYGQIEWEILVDKLTVHETRFFRDSHALDLIQTHSLEPILAQPREQAYTVHAWSVGCATGEEPYTLAMLIDHMFCQNDKLYYGVTASDLSLAALRTGRDAIYHQRRIKNVPEDMAAKYLSPVDDEHVQVSESLRQKVCFTQINLRDDIDAQPIYEMDIILCQNVLIYFSFEMRNRILTQLVTRLKPGGLLVLGAGEVFGWSHPELTMIKHASTLAYRRLPARGVY